MLNRFFMAKMPKHLGCYINSVLLHNKVLQTCNINHTDVWTHSCAGANSGVTWLGPSLRIRKPQTNMSVMLSLCLQVLRKTLFPSWFTLLAEMNFLLFVELRSLLAFNPLTGDCSQFLEAAHTPGHVTPSIFKSAMGHQMLLRLWVSDLLFFVQ